MPVRAFPSLPVLAACLLLPFVILGRADAGGFAGQKLLIDTHIGPELGRTNDGEVALLPHPAGKTIQIELFIEGAHAHKTTGYTIAFDNTGNDFKDHFEIERIDGLLRQSGRPGPISVESGAAFPAIVQANNYIATVTLTTKRAIPQETTIGFSAEKTVVIDSRTSETDKLDVSEALLTFSFAKDFSISLDLDSAPANQNVQSLIRVQPDTEIPIQIFGIDIRFTVGAILRFEYDGSKIIFDGFDVGDVLPNAQTVEPILGKVVVGSAGSPDFVEVTAAALGGTATEENGLLGTIRFLTGPVFEGTSIRMVNAEIRRGGQFVELKEALAVALRNLTSDFDDDGQIGFRDFLLFAEKFGSQRGDGIYNELFDLDGDGIIEFSDFLILSESFG